MKIKTAADSGFTLVEIMIVVAIIGMLASIAIPNYVKARDNSQQQACINTLRQIDGAAQTWCLETRKTSASIYTLTDVEPYIKLDRNGKIPSCPAGGTYSPGAAVSNAPTCTLSSVGHALP